MKANVAQASCLWGLRASRLPIYDPQAPDKMPGVPAGWKPVLL